MKIIYFQFCLQIDPCSEHKCRRGSICVANSNAKEGYSCRCKIGTRGKYCEQGDGPAPSNPVAGIFHTNSLLIFFLKRKQNIADLVIVYNILMKYAILLAVKNDFKRFFL